MEVWYVTLLTAALVPLLAVAPAQVVVVVPLLALAPAQVVVVVVVFFLPVM